MPKNASHEKDQEETSENTVNGVSGVENPGGEPGATDSVGPEPTTAGTEAAGGDPAIEGSQAPELTAEEQIAALEEQLREVKDQYLRKAADFENFRKRMNREKQEAIDFANQSLLLDLILIIDDFERAIKSVESLSSASKEFDSFYEGINMIEKRLTSQLENKWGLKRFDSAGEAFDPNRHEALMMEKSPEIAEPVVKEEFLKGYTLKDRVVRSAKVKVLMPGEATEQ
ncbi:co-chaperone GrpE [Treponema primitia ZAS-2]|uniref:Protein GrpE n=1 Tax=Treponema primitia (strain ATCC BAA-887 / DSM 12427 / ZAS-2) TaxID=545694 RepID=F5YN63_TREPZ|nr:nucleotide exchange factor GrpE [Treponema primitia]AEF84472.1 co-chaperone GrpE [Treponema primitia ZAS-2]